MTSALDPGEWSVSLTDYFILGKGACGIHWMGHFNVVV
jgi:hypothetical protein